MTPMPVKKEPGVKEEGEEEEQKQEEEKEEELVAVKKEPDVSDDDEEMEVYTVNAPGRPKLTFNQTLCRLPKGFMIEFQEEGAPAGSLWKLISLSNVIEGEGRILSLTFESLVEVVLKNLLKHQGNATLENFEVAFIYRDKDDKCYEVTDSKDLEFIIVKHHHADEMSDCMSLRVRITNKNNMAAVAPPIAAAPAVVAAAAAPPADTVAFASAPADDSFRDKALPAVANDDAEENDPQDERKPAARATARCRAPTKRTAEPVPFPDFCCTQTGRHVVECFFPSCTMQGNQLSVDGEDLEYFPFKSETTMEWNAEMKQPPNNMAKKQGSRIRTKKNRWRKHLGEHHLSKRKGGKKWDDLKKEEQTHLAVKHFPWLLLLDKEKEMIRKEMEE